MNLGPGTRIGPYEIGASIGAGGMGEVHRARDSRLNRDVAIKVLPATVASDPERLRRFALEAQTTGALNHPNILAIYDVGSHEGQPYLVAELLLGETLRGRLDAGPVPQSKAVDYIRQAAAGLAAAHSAGITHRDIKPDNLFLTNDGRIKILDFGLARVAPTLADGETHLEGGTSPGVVLGTVGYMSPEQVRGKPVDQRSDLFSLGVVLYELLSGRRPFVGDSAVQTMNAVLTEDPPDLSKSGRNIPPALAQVVHHCLEKNPEERFQSARDLSFALQAASTSSSVAGAVDAAPPGRRALRRSVLAAAAVLSLLAVGAWAYWFLRPGREASQLFEVAKVTRLTSEGKAAGGAISPDGRFVAHFKGLTLWIRQRDTLSDVQIVGPGHDGFNGVSFTPDGTHIYFVGYSRPRQMGTLFKVAALGGPATQIIDDVDTGVAVSPDGRRLAFVRGVPATGKTHLMIAEANGTGARALATLGPDRKVSFIKPSWSRDGRRLLVVVGETVGVERAYAVDVESGAMTSVSAPWAMIYSVEWLPDGESFIVSAMTTFGENAQLWEGRIATQERRRITNDMNVYSLVSLSADGSSLLTVEERVRASLWIVPREGEAKPLVQAQRDDGVHGLAWSSSGRIVFQSNRLGTRQLWSIQPDGSDARQLTDDGEGGGFPAASRDGRHIVYARKTADSIEIWRTSFDGTPPIRLVAAGGFPVVCHDGWVYYAAIDRSVLGSASLRVRIEGGTPETPFAHNFRVTDCLPNGDLLGYLWDETRKRSAVARLRRSGELQVLDRVPSAGTVDLKATPDGSGLTVRTEIGGRAEVWMTTWDQTPPVRLTNSGTDRIYNYAWSPDGRHLVVSRGHGESDLVLLQRK